MRKQVKRLIFGFLLVTLLLPLAGCSISVRRIGPTPTPPPPPPPDSACAMISISSLQAWIDERISRYEEPLVGGVVYLDSPQVIDCAGDSATYAIRVGYERSGFAVELALLENELGLLYDADRSEVCIDVHSMLFSEPLSDQGLQEVGQEIRVAEAQNALSTSTAEMPADLQQEVNEALNERAIQGDPAVEGIGTDVAGLLIGWAVDRLLERFNQDFSRLIGACLPAE